MYRVNKTFSDNGIWYREGDNVEIHESRVPNLISHSVISAVVDFQKPIQAVETATVNPVVETATVNQVKHGRPPKRI